LFFHNLAKEAKQMGLVIFLLVLLNLAISFWNARVTGLVWAETKAIGGFTRFMTWMGATMAAVGFSWCYLIILALGAQTLGYLDAKGMKVALELGYIILVPLVLFSGFFIWIDSVVQAWRQRDFASIGTAAWNTFAQAHNTYSAIEGFGDAFSSVMEAFTGDADEDTAKALPLLLIVGLVAFALAGGVITTIAIVKNYAGSRPMPSMARA
jgi:hypothetical protein